MTNEQIRAVIVDDDPFAREELIFRINQVAPGVRIIGDFEEPHEAIIFINNFKPDLLFLDVQMPNLNGFQLLDSLQHSELSVIFTSSFDQYAIRAFRYSALDFLIKPVNPIDLAESIAKSRANIESKSMLAKIKNLQKNLGNTDHSEGTLLIPARNGDVFIQLTEITRLQADRAYTLIFYGKNQKLIASKPLKYFEDILEDNIFLRPHKSHIVSKLWIAEITEDKYIQMTDGVKIEIARRRLNDIVRLVNS